MKTISWTYPSAPQLKDGQYNGVAEHGLYLRGHEGDPAGETWFAFYLPPGGEPQPVPLAGYSDRFARKVSASAMYEACTNHNALMQMQNA